MLQNQLIYRIYQKIEIIIFIYINYFYYFEIEQFLRFPELFFDHYNPRQAERRGTFLYRRHVLVHTELGRIPNFERDALLVILSICRRYKKLARREDSHVLIGPSLALKIVIHYYFSCLFTLILVFPNYDEYMSFNIFHALRRKLRGHVRTHKVKSLNIAKRLSNFKKIGKKGNFNPQAVGV